MRIIELLVDGQRIKLTTDENVTRAVVVGDLKPATRVVIWEHDEEVFVGAAMDDPQLRALFPPEMFPAVPGTQKITPVSQDAAAAPEIALAAVPALLEEQPVEAEPVRVTRVHETPVVNSADADQEAFERRLEAARRFHERMDRAKAQSSSAPVEAKPARVTRVQDAPIVRASDATTEESLQRRLEAARLLHEQMDREQAQQVAMSSGAKPRPWRHWVAKLIDLPFLVFAATLAGALLGGGFWPDQPAAIVIISIGMIFVIEALIMRVFGATLGKGLLNIQVRKNGRHIGFFAGIGRSLQSHIVGAGAWIPIISIVVMLGARTRMLEAGRSAWDLGAGNQVTYGKIGFLRAVGIIGFFVLAYLLLAAAGGL